MPKYGKIAQYLVVLAGISVEDGGEEGEEGEVAVRLSLLAAVPLSLLVAAPLSLLVLACQDYFHVSIILYSRLHCTTMCVCVCACVYVRVCACRCVWFCELTVGEGKKQTERRGPFKN